MRRFVTLFIALVFVFLALPQAQAQVFGKGKSVIVSRPDPEGTPTQVRVGCYIIDLVKINDVEQDFTADVFFRMQWQDKRLAPAAGASKETVRRIPLGEIWYPSFTVLNRRDFTVMYPDEVEVDTKGNVTYRQRIYGQFSLPLNLHEFPFDSHEIPIDVIILGYEPGEINVVLDEEVMGRADNFSVADWTIGKLSFRTDVYPATPRGDSMPMYIFEMEGKRKVDFYVLRIVVPLMLIMLMSWMVFWIDPNHLEAQVGISATSILTLIAFQFTVGVLLPRISYLTRMDVFIMFTSLLVFLALVEGVTTSALATRGRQELAYKFDRWSRVLFPAAFIVGTVVAFVL